LIRALELENFKGIASRQRVDFAPLTLLFGPNSAGKSTVLQALIYLHELLERGAADVDRTELGGNVLELGGFARLVHRHDLSRSIVLRVEFTTPGGLERFGRRPTDSPFPNLDDDVKSAWLELVVRFRTTKVFRGPLVERAAIGVGDNPTPLVWLETGATLRDGEPLNARVNLGHPLLRTIRGEEFEDFELAWTTIAQPIVPLHITPSLLDEEHLDYLGGLRAGGALWDLSQFGEPKSLPVFAVSRSRLSALPSLSEPLRIIESEGGDNDGQYADADPEEMALLPSPADQVRTFLEMLVIWTVGQLLDSLRDAIYIGPLRTIPPRGFLYERVGRISSWADGLAAWDLLLADRLRLVDTANVWLEQLQTQCKVVVQRLYDTSASAEELSSGHVDRTVRRLLLDTGADSLVLPSEVGAGISQVIPVVVAALGRASLSLIEQPEIHVHPAIQVGLGDLFIEAVTRDSGHRTMLVETHSEHVILRILRRIRETTEQDLAEGAPAFSAEKLSVLYVEGNSEGVRIRRLQVDERGEFTDSWPRGFFDERFAEIYGK
jgi:predicted ATPase